MLYIIIHYELQSFQTLPKNSHRLCSFENSPPFFLYFVLSDLRATVQSRLRLYFILPSYY